MDDLERNNLNGSNHNNEENDVPKNSATPSPIATYSDRDEETAAELTADDMDTRINEVDDGDNDLNVNSPLGWTAIALSIISFFWLPIILGAAGIIVGFMARNRGSTMLGYTAIAAGVLSIIISLFARPFV